MRRLPITRGCTPMVRVPVRQGRLVGRFVGFVPWLPGNDRVGDALGEREPRRSLSVGL
jgi:hypothetical protein